MYGCSAQTLFPSFVAALKAKPGSDEESKKQGVLVQVRGKGPIRCFLLLAGAGLHMREQRRPALVAT